jgi:hypothetical protein
LRQRTNGRSAKVKGQYAISAQVQVVHSDGRPFGVTAIFYELFCLTERIVRHLDAVPVTLGSP